MKSIVTSLFVLVLTINGLLAQNNNLVVYSQDGYKFTLILNGIRQNTEPQTNVKVTGLNALNYQAKVIFANNMPDVDQNVYLMFGGEQGKNMEYSYSITKVKTKFKLKYKSEAPINTVVADPQQTVIVYNPNGPVANTAVVNTSTVNGGTTVVNSGTVGGASTTTTTTTTTTGADPMGGNVGVNVNGMGMGVNVNINATGTGANTNMSSTTTSSTTTTTTSSSTGGFTTTGGTTTTTIGGGNSGYVLQGYNGVYGCPYPMSPADFESAKESIKSKGFDESRLTIAKQIIGTNCLLSSQVKDLMKLMSFEETKLDLAKFAWPYTLDRGNYYKLNDAFSFESSIEELDNYIKSH